MSKLEPKSLKCIFLGYSRVQKGYMCYCPSKYMVFSDVTFLENTHFSQGPIHTSLGEDYDLLVYTLASTPASIPPLTKPPTTQVYPWRQHLLVSSPPSVASTLDPLSNDDLPIAFRKGKRSVFTKFPHFVLITICHHIPVLLLHPWI